MRRNITLLFPYSKNIPDTSSESIANMSALCITKLATDFYKQPVNISRWLHGIMKTNIQCEKVVNITTALEICSNGQGILCSMCCTVRMEQNLFLPRDITILDKKYVDSQRKELKLVTVMSIYLNKKHY